MEIEFYDLPNGKSPAKEFILTLEPKMYAKMLHTIVLLQTNGTDLRLPHSESLGDGIFQLRAKSGNNISRILFFFYYGNKAILTNGFVKKTPKTPPGVIELAKKYRADYIARHEHEQL